MSKSISQIPDLCRPLAVNPKIDKYRLDALPWHHNQNYLFRNRYTT